MQNLPPILLKQLRRQLTFLRNSAASYDGGYPEEALRIGVVIRVLLHDTKYSTSLLKQLGQKEWRIQVRGATKMNPVIGG